MRDESYETGYRAGHLQGGLTPWPSFRRQDSRPPGDGTTAAASKVPTPTLPEPADVGTSPVTGVVFGESFACAAGVAAGIDCANGSPRRSQFRRLFRLQRPNINITLYVASLLLVAAAALFIGTSLPPMLRFAGVCAVTALFYGAGFVLHARVPRLKPAAVAFSGTGLALVPVTGLALYNFAVHHGPTAWLITSLVGTAAHVAATVRLESRVLAYLSLTFVASPAFSGVSILGGALVGYFAVLIAVAVLLTGIAPARPGWSWALSLVACATSPATKLPAGS